MMKNVFLDSNIWLSLFHYSNDDLEQFSKLKNLLDSDINLIVTRQVVDEVLRNRDNKIYDAMKKFELPRFYYPVFAKQYDAYKSFLENYDSLETVYNSWKSEVIEDISATKTPADLVIDSFFSIINVFDYSEDTLDKAIKRYNLGNPPGKDKSYGDAINWESLLECVPDGEDLYFVSGDNDFTSVLDNNKMNSYLLNEWIKKKNSKIIFYKTLVDFLKDHFKEIKLEIEKNKEELIESLQLSGTYKTTHLVIENMNKYSEWTEDQVSKLCYAGITNGQVSRIITDYDVFSFFYNLLNDYVFEEIEDDTIKEMYIQIDRLLDAGYPVDEG